MDARLTRSALFPYTTLFRSPNRPARAGVSRTSHRRHRRNDRSFPRGLDGRVMIGHQSPGDQGGGPGPVSYQDRKSTRLNSSHGYISYAVFCLKKKKKYNTNDFEPTTESYCHRTNRIKGIWLSSPLQHIFSTFFTIIYLITARVQYSLYFIYAF